MICGPWIISVCLTGTKLRVRVIECIRVPPVWTRGALTRRIRAAAAHTLSAALPVSDLRFPLHTDRGAIQLQQWEHSSSITQQLVLIDLDASIHRIYISSRIHDTLYHYAAQRRPAALHSAVPPASARRRSGARLPARPEAHPRPARDARPAVRSATRSCTLVTYTYSQCVKYVWSDVCSNININLVLLFNFVDSALLRQKVYILDSSHFILCGPLLFSQYFAPKTCWFDIIRLITGFFFKPKAFDDMEIKFASVWCSNKSFMYNSLS